MARRPETVGLIEPPTGQLLGPTVVALSLLTRIVTRGPRRFYREGTGRHGDVRIDTASNKHHWAGNVEDDRTIRPPVTVGVPPSEVPRIHKAGPT